MSQRAHRALDGDLQRELGIARGLCSPIPPSPVTVPVRDHVTVLCLPQQKEQSRGVVAVEAKKKKALKVRKHPRCVCVARIALPGAGVWSRGRCCGAGCHRSTIKKYHKMVMKRQAERSTADAMK